MSRRGALAIVALLASALAAPRRAPALDVAILQPRPGEPVFGQVAFEVEVYPVADLAVVELLVDGRSVARFERPPFQVLADVGQDNRRHRFEVVAQAISGEVVSSFVETPAVPVDLELRVELRQLYVTVTRDGERVLDLERPDFTVLDGGVAQRLVTFERGDVPFTAILLVDASLSMRGDRLQAAVAGARTFAAGMRPLDQTKVVLFSDRVLHSTPFSGFHQVITAGLSRVAAHGGTALNDHLYLAVRLLERRQGRRLVVLLSDGIDVESVLEMRQVVEAAGRARSLIYWIRLGSPDPRLQRHSAWRDAVGHRRELDLLERAVVQSGGRIATLGSIAETEAAFGAVLDEIREQYVLGYYPSESRGDGGWRRVRVKVRGSGLEVRAREGYVDEPAL